MSSQHDVLEVDDRETNADEKKKRWKGLRDVFNTFQWYSEGDENKVDKITKSSRGIVIWEELLKDKKTFFYGIYLLGESIDSYMTDLCNKAARCDLAQ